MSNIFNGLISHKCFPFFPSSLILSISFSFSLSFLFHSLSLYLLFPSRNSSLHLFSSSLFPVTGGFILHCTSDLSETLAYRVEQHHVLFLLLSPSLYPSIPSSLPPSLVLITPPSVRVEGTSLAIGVGLLLMLCIIATITSQGGGENLFFPPVSLPHLPIMQRSVIEF